MTALVVVQFFVLIWYSQTASAHNARNQELEAAISTQIVEAARVLK
jgi:hypothetical protein